ncbi:hypothetical protein E2F47_00765 [Mycobacterium eburneum]|nr:hypothetical protein [Mycobacterium eburneum]TDH57730.1 hypothetical protein E2F47_00765 [Mycobacterium eburneum]
MQPALNLAAGDGVVALGAPRSTARLRPYLAAGVALAGASLIAIGPAAPTAAGMQERAVELASAADLIASVPNPVTEWLNVFSGAFTNVTQIGQEILADPLPILTQVLHNQIGFADTLVTNGQSIAGTLGEFLVQSLPQALQTLVSGIASGDISDAVSNFNSDLLLGLLPVAFPLQTILGIPQEMAQNLTNALGTLPGVGLSALLAPVGVLFGTTQALADSAQSVVDAFGAGQPLAAFTDLLNIPAVVTGALLNGYSTEFVDYTGLLSSGASVAGSGILYDFLVQFPQEIAQALGASSADALDPTSMVADLGSLIASIFTAF